MDLAVRLEEDRTGIPALRSNSSSSREGSMGTGLLRGTCTRLRGMSTRLRCMDSSSSNSHSHNSSSRCLGGSRHAVICDTSSQLQFDAGYWRLFCSKATY